MKENPFFTIEQPNVRIIPTLQKLDNRTLDKFMAILWNPGGDSLSFKRNTAIDYIKESEYVKKSQNEQENIREIAEIEKDQNS